MNRQELIRQFLALAQAIEDSGKPDVARELREAVTAPYGAHIERTWIVRWNSQRKNRVAGHALVFTRSGGFSGGNKPGFPGVIPEHFSLDTVSVKAMEPINATDCRDAARARELGLQVEVVNPHYTAPDPRQVTTQQEFERVCSVARPKWVDDAPTGEIEGRNEVWREPGFCLLDVPQAWIGPYSHLTAFSADGGTEYYVSTSCGGGGPVDLRQVPPGARWRIDRDFVEELLRLQKEGSKVMDDEDVTFQKSEEDRERRRLAEKFAAQSTS